jgi:5-methyltetrahydrofolate--homocysteine methyltransferase
MNSFILSLLIDTGEINLLVIGERINSSIKNVEKAISEHDLEFIQAEVSNQLQAGAKVIDLNAGTFIKSELDELFWLIQGIKDLPGLTPEIGIALDSSDADIIEGGLEEMTKLGLPNKPMINSVTAEQEKLDNILPLVSKFDTHLIGLCMNENGIPNEPGDRVQLGLDIIKACSGYDIPKTNILIDPLVLPVSTDINNGLTVLKAIKLLKQTEPECITVMGLSNISYGLPKRELMNRTYITMAMLYGLDAAILNPLDKDLMAGIKATETLLGKDNYCMNYIKAYRDGKL